MSKLFLVLLFAIALITPAVADDAEDAAKANEAYASGDYETAYPLILSFAERGDAQAQFTLGVMYDRGLGVAKDDAEALLWYLNAAEQDHPSAQMNLGLMHAKGRGVLTDYVEAYRWLDRAAANYPPGEGRAKAIRNRDLALSLMSPEQMAKVPVRAQHIAQAQAALARLGYDPGPADGIIGRRTRDAVVAYERDRGLPETGELTHALIRRIAEER